VEKTITEKRVFMSFFKRFSEEKVLINDADERSECDSFVRAMGREVVVR
jgi:hypothetical protein